MAFHIYKMYNKFYKYLGMWGKRSAGEKEYFFATQHRHGIEEK